MQLVFDAVFYVVENPKYFILNKIFEKVHRSFAYVYKSLNLKNEEKQTRNAFKRNDLLSRLQLWVRLQLWDNDSISPAIIPF